jgi:hypothetical protein
MEPSPHTKLVETASVHNRVKTGNAAWEIPQNNQGAPWPTFRESFDRMPSAICLLVIRAGAIPQVFPLQEFDDFP